VNLTGIWHFLHDAYELIYIFVHEPKKNCSDYA